MQPLELFNPAGLRRIRIIFARSIPFRYRFFVCSHRFLRNLQSLTDHCLLKTYHCLGELSSFSRCQRIATRGPQCIALHMTAFLQQYCSIASGSLRPSGQGVKREAGAPWQKPGQCRRCPRNGRRAKADHAATALRRGKAIRRVISDCSRARRPAWSLGSASRRAMDRPLGGSVFSLVSSVHLRLCSISTAPRAVARGVDVCFWCLFCATRT